MEKIGTRAMDGSDLDADTLLAMLPPSQDLVEFYQKKLKHQKQQYDALLITLDKLEESLKSKYTFEDLLGQALKEAEDARRKANDIQVLFDSERSRSLLLAATIDKLQIRHQRDKEIISLLKKLSGEGKLNDHLSPLENSQEKQLEVSLQRLEKLLEEQALSFLQDHQTLRYQSEIERSNLEKQVRRLTERVRVLEKQEIDAQKKITSLVQEQTQMSSQWELQRQLHALTGPESATSVSEPASVPAWLLNSNETAVKVHELSERLKKFQDSLHEAKKENDKWKRTNEEREAEIIRLRTAFSNIAGKQKERDEGFQQKLTHLTSQLEKLEQRRLTEAKGFRNEIRLLKEELSRAQRGLYYLSLKETKA